MKWKTRAFINRVLNDLPGGHIVYHKGQRFVGDLRKTNIDDKLRQGVRLIAALREIRDLDSLRGKHGVEIGTGWIPVMPLFFWSLGLEKCDTYDVEKLLDASRFVKVARQLVDVSLADKLTLNEIEREFVTSKVDSLDLLLKTNPTAQEILNFCGINYHAPSDADRTGLADGSVDFVFSNTVLEHIDEEKIDRLFIESRRILRPGGYMLHLIDLSDHFSYQDTTITGINFLQYSEGEFARYNTRFLNQNRLRASHWQDIFVRHGFEILYLKALIDRRAMSALPTFPLDTAFRSLADNDNCTDSICVLASSP